MRTGRRVNRRIKDNRGISLVELIVVIAIMAVMVGVTSLGLGMMFSRDANYVAVRIDDALSEARTLSMSKEGTFTCVIDIDPSDGGKNAKHKAMIYQTIGPDKDHATTTLVKEIALNKSTSIAITGGAGLPAVGEDVAFVFSKSKGNVTKAGAGGGTDVVNNIVYNGTEASGVYEITVTSTKNSSKIRKVTLVATTGRHYTDK